MPLRTCLALMRPFYKLVGDPEGRGLAVLEAGTAERPSGAAGQVDATAGMEAPLLASATAWKRVVERRCAIFGCAPSWNCTPGCSRTIPR